jgi:endonuclease/exonuclease/phosphatase family metal-dependent hydrolase
MATPNRAAEFLGNSDELEFGNVPARDSPPGDKVVICSYNIRYAVGQFLISSGLLRKAGFNFPRRRSEVVAENIRTAAQAFRDELICPAPDLLALQEADKGTERTGKHHVARELAQELEMNWVHAPAGLPRGIAPQERQWWLDFEEQIGLYDEGDTGVALLSRPAFADVIRIDLPWQECPWRPRLSLGATINIGERQIRIFNSHIDPHSSVSGQIEQLEIVLAEAEKTSMPTVLLGDFNTLSQRKCLDTRRLLESHGFITPFPTGTATWRGAGIRLHADWIFVRSLRVHRWGVGRPLNVSDHWPIWAEIGLS